MKEQELHKMIREQGSVDNTETVDRLKALHPEIGRADIGTKRKRTSVKKRVAFFAPLAAVAVAAIILIPILVTEVGDGGEAGDDRMDHSPQAIEYVDKKMEFPVQEYNRLCNADFLYFDWGDRKNSILIEYREATTRDFYALTADLNNPETEEKIEYTVCRTPELSSSLAVELLDKYKTCVKEKTVGDRSVKWATEYGNAYGVFTFETYDYYFMLKGSSDETRLFELIEELLS